MNRTIAISILAGLLLSTASPETAFGGSGGSSYSIFGLGDLSISSGVRSAGMGYTGFGLPTVSNLNGLAPANWSRIDRVRIEASFLYAGYNSTDGERSRYLARADFNGALLAIPISQPNGIVLVGGFLPFSTYNYDAFTEGSFTGPADTMDYGIHHVGSGGIMQGVLGLSYAPTQHLSVGLSTNVLFGSLNGEKIQVPTNSRYTGGLVADRTTASGLTFTLGALYTGLGTVIPSLERFSIGAALTSRGILSAESRTTYRFSDAEVTTERDTSGTSESQITVPVSFGVGIGYQATDRIILAADYQTQGWSNSTFRGENNPPYLRNSRRFGVGVELLPSRESGASWGAQLGFRLGGYYNASYVRPNGEPINGWGVTAGMALPFSGDTRLNLAAEYGERGTLAKELIKDKIFRFNLSLNISALWFVQYPED